jgi:hypothetical protein
MRTNNKISFTAFFPYTGKKLEIEQKEGISIVKLITFNPQYLQVEILESNGGSFIIGATINLAISSIKSFKCLEE